MPMITISIITKYTHFFIQQLTNTNQIIPIELPQKLAVVCTDICSRATCNLNPVPLGAD